MYADIKPEEIVLYKPRKEGGLNLINVKLRALAELIKSFLDTAINPRFRRNLYHQALYQWHVKQNRTILDPGKSPFYNSEFFRIIKMVEEEGLLRLSSEQYGVGHVVQGSS